MDTVTVTTKEELEEAKNKAYSEIIIKGEFANKFYKTKKIAKLGKASLAVIITAIGVGATTGVGAAAIILASSIGIALIIAIFKDYEEISYKEGEFVLRKKQSKN
ncbi:hypothetical protein [Arcobacter vandammei]|uniref:hypothetical protein n=1 Tax=Arcobacter vandammei TaxID=2782243 RepID=UPI0018E05A83|nr:hypothetical protein [Arcobacter vandammei]